MKKVKYLRVEVYEEHDDGTTTIDAPIHGFGGTRVVRGKVADKDLLEVLPADEMPEGVGPQPPERQRAGYVTIKVPLPKHIPAEWTDQVEYWEQTSRPRWQVRVMKTPEEQRAEEQQRVEEIGRLMYLAMKDALGMIPGDEMNRMTEYHIIRHVCYALGDRFDQI